MQHSVVPKAFGSGFCFFFCSGVDSFLKWKNQRYLIKLNFTPSKINQAFLIRCIQKDRLNE